MNPGKDRVDPYDTECTGTEEYDNGRGTIVLPIPRDAAVVAVHK